VIPKQFYEAETFELQDCMQTSICHRINILKGTYALVEEESKLDVKLSI
jgi:hypothetical protein